MKKILLLCLGVIGILAAAPAGKVPLASQDLGVQQGGGLFSPQMLENILDYQTWGGLFVYLQVHWFKLLFGSIALGMIVIFLLHYLIIGAKEFSHKGRKFYIFSLFMRIVHWLAALAFVLIIPTGFMMIFGKYLGGGDLVLTARYLHSIGTVLFAVSVIPMFLVWFIPMLPTFDDIKWMMIVGGYLSKKKREVPAGKFNAGQKLWFWLATVGGLVMIATGAMMYFQDFNLPVLKTMGLDIDQIDLIRISAIAHNFLGMVIAALFITHLYMSLFAIKGSLSSMIDGHKSEDELKHLHSSYYKKLMKKEAEKAQKE
jgi:formate dehydrogenase subunit gamma